MEERRLTPLLIISDAVSSGTGFGRIAREIATRAATNLSDVCRIATAGYGGPGSIKLPFPQYSLEGIEENFILPTLPEVWNDFSEDGTGIVFCIWDVARLPWFSSPNAYAWTQKHAGLMRWLINAKFKKWIYAPIDAEGANGKLSFPIFKTLYDFNRVLSYSDWGKKVIENTLGSDESQRRDLDALPHGISSNDFYPTKKSLCRRMFFQATSAQTFSGHVNRIEDDEILIGVVATNQIRKDMGLMFDAVSRLAKNHKVRLWLHTDTLERAWSIPTLAADFDLLDKLLLSLHHISDQQMGEAYSACDLTIAPGLGEGFGFPIFESAFCGVPCVHGNYGGAPEHGSIVPVEPVAYRYEGPFCYRRPVYDAADFTRAMESIIKDRPKVLRPDHLDWVNLWPKWEEWFRRGLA